MCADFVRNAMSVDVEDYFQVSAFESRVPTDTWHEYPQRVESNTNRVLDLFAEAGVRATFFMLGWVAERYPELVRRILAEGHELASHGYQHILVHRQTPVEFRRDVSKTKALLEDIGGIEVRGYRAASYSINGDTLWALQILPEVGYRYSSSIYPIAHDLYGMPLAPRFRFEPHPGFVEVPVTTARLFGRNLPCGGGGYFRLLPYPVSRWAIRRVNEHDRQSGVFYFHPWEVDPTQPRPLGLGIKTRFRHYLNLAKMESRLRRLLRDFAWGRMDEIFLDVGGGVPKPAATR